MSMMFLLVTALVLALAQAENMRCPQPDSWPVQPKLHLRIDNFHQYYYYDDLKAELLSTNSITLYPGESKNYRKLFYLDEGWYENQTKGIHLDTHFFYDGDKVCVSYTYLSDAMHYNLHYVRHDTWECKNECFPVVQFMLDEPYKPEFPAFKYSTLETVYQFFTTNDDYVVQMTATFP